MMTLDPLDIQAILTDADESGSAWSGLPEGTRIGHMHLQVADVQQSTSFYNRVVGMDVTNQLIPSAAFLSIGGYHHHLGLNSWNTAGATRPDADIAGLLDWRITVGDCQVKDELLQRAELAGTLKDAGTEPAIVDPDGLLLRIA